MGILGSKPGVTKNDKVIFELKRQRDLLTKYQLQLQTNINTEKSMAVRYAKEKDPTKAKQALKRKAFLLQILQKTDVQLENLDQMTHTLESAVIQQQVMQSLSTSNQALKDLNNEMSLDKMQLLLEETEEARLYQDEFNHQLEEFANTQQDEQELNQELEKLQLQALEEKLPPVPIAFPDVPLQEPTHETPQKERAKEAPLLAS